jgi:hypothetical protein
MAQILVKTPVTSNGRDVILGADGRVQYKETILMAAAKPVIEKQNAKLPPLLKKIVTDWPGELVQDAEPADDNPVKQTRTRGPNKSKDDN